MEFTKYVEPPGRFHLWTALVILSATLARKVYKPRGLFTLYPNLYVGLIGPTGIGKSTAAEIGVNHFGETIKSSGSEVMTGKITSWYLYDWFGQMSQGSNPAVALIFSSELKTLLGDLNKAELVAMLTDIYGCPEDREYRTKTHDIIRLQEVYLNLLVCSTPEWLTLGISADDISGGFTGRFIYVCEEKTERSFPFPEDFYGATEIKEAKEVLVEDLARIATLEGPVIFTDEAVAKYTMWYSDRMKELTEERLIGYYSRKRDHMMKVAMLLSVAEGDSLVVTEGHLDLAQEILTKTEENMMVAFRGIVDDPVLRYRDLVMRQVKDRGEVMMSELLARNTTRLDEEGLRKVLNTLQAEGKLVWGADQDRDKHGRAKFKVRWTG
jgi:hypothetical protein